MKLNEEKLEELLASYPLLEVLLQAGTVSNKIVREVLEIDRWLMQELQQKMLLNGIIIGVTGSTFRASFETLEYLRRR